MKNEQLSLSKSTAIIIKKCHICGTIHESYEEVSKCSNCKKAFLPTNYFSKVHAKTSDDYQNLFCSAEELVDLDFIVGLTVIW